MAASVKQKKSAKAKRRKPARAPAGAPPGRIVAQPGASPTRLRFNRFAADWVNVPEHEEAAFAEGAEGALWVDVAGLADVAKIEALCTRLGLHRLSIADIFNTGQRPKADIYEGYVHIVLRQPLGMNPYVDEQLTLILGEGFVLTVQETPDDCFDPVRERLHAGGPRIRASAGYLSYALMDALVDAYFPILENYGEQTEALEDRILDGADDALIAEIHALRRALLSIRHTLWPQREAISMLLRHDVPFVDEDLRTYLRDVADHSTQLIDMLEVYREVAQGLVDLHLSMLSNRMNEVMKVLTIISTIFIPMTFIAGLYGMNFTDSPFNMPELRWHFGYFYALSLMAGSASIMLWWFFRKGWLGRKARAGTRIAPSQESEAPVRTQGQSGAGPDAGPNASTDAGPFISPHDRARRS